VGTSDAGRHRQEIGATVALTALWVAVAWLASHLPDTTPGWRWPTLYLANVVSIPAVVLIVGLVGEQSRRAGMALAFALFGLPILLSVGGTASGIAAWALCVLAFIAYLRVFGTDDMLEGTILGAALACVCACLLLTQMHIQMAQFARPILPG